MKLVADAALRAAGDHRGALVAQRVRVLEAAELAPGGVELSGHAEEFHPEIAAVGGRHRVVVVAPAAGRQRFKFEVAEVLENLGVAHRHMAGVVEDRHLRIAAPGGGGAPLVVFEQHLPRIGEAVLRLGRIESFRLHSRHAVFAAAGALRNDVEEDPVRVGEERHGLFDLAAEVVQIGGVEAEFRETRFERRMVPAAPAPLAIDFAPFGVFPPLHLIDAGGEVDRHVDADLVAGVDLFAQQVEFEMGMHPPHFGRVVAPAVMAAREAGDRIDRGVAESLLPLPAVERFSDSFNEGGGVEIEMNLTKTHDFP